VSGLEFLSADPSSPAWRSPLRRALERAPIGIRDVSALVDESEVAKLGPAAGIAGIEIEGPEATRLLRRLTDLDLAALPAIGAVAHVRALVTANGDGRYQLWFPQEYADYVAAVVLDTARGIGWG
jgi:sarcosine oxidase gamma subunit